MKPSKHLKNEIIDILNGNGFLVTEITDDDKYIVKFKFTNEKVIAQVYESWYSMDQIGDDYLICSHILSKKEIMDNLDNFINQLMDDCRKFEKIKFTIFYDTDRIKKEILEVVNDISYEDFDEDGVAKISVVNFDDKFSIDFAFYLKGKKVLLDYYELYYEDEYLVGTYETTINKIKKNPEKMIYFLMDEIDCFLHED